MLFLGIDIGTTNTKAVLIDRSNELLGSRTIPFHYGSDRTQADADQWYQHIAQVVKVFDQQGLLGEEEIVVSLATQGGSYLLLDDEYQPCSPAFIWTGCGSEESAQEIESHFGLAHLYRTTGWATTSYLIPCKLKDLLASNPGLLKDSEYLATVCDFLHAKMGGGFFTDITNAQITQLCRFQEGDWYEEMLRYLGIEASMLPSIIKSPRVIHEDIVIEGKKLILTTSSHDQYAVMRTTGIEKDMAVLLATGTAWVLSGRSNQPLYDDRNLSIHPGRDLQPGAYGYIVGLGPLGNLFDNLLRFHNLSYDDVLVLQKKTKNLPLPESRIELDADEGLLSSCEDPNEAIRRFMEAVASRVAYFLEIHPTADCIEEIVLTGGAARNSMWPEIISNVTGKAVRCLNLLELTAYGAALFAKDAVEQNASHESSPNRYSETTYHPEHYNEYRGWYEECQRPVWENEFSKGAFQ